MRNESHAFQTQLWPCHFLVYHHPPLISVHQAHLQSTQHTCRVQNAKRVTCARCLWRAPLLFKFFFVFFYRFFCFSHWLQKNACTHCVAPPPSLDTSLSAGKCPITRNWVDPLSAAHHQALDPVKQSKKPIEVSLGNPSKGTITYQSDCQGD